MNPSLCPETLMSLLKMRRHPVVVDVRKRPAFEADPAMLPSAVWRDPHAVEQWAAKLPPGRGPRRGERAGFRAPRCSGPGLRELRALAG
jgi:hypothetical protein